MTQTSMSPCADEAALDLMFRHARTRNGWTPATIAQALLEEIYDLAKWGPTSANSSPARFVFVASEAAKARLLPCLMEGNRAKTAAAPVCVIVAYDLSFPSQLSKLFPHRPGVAGAFSDPRMIEETAFRNGTLQGAYLMLAARALGLDCGPMSGFDAAALNAEFFPDSSLRANFLCNLGYGSDENLFPRSPRLSFAEACQVL